MIKTPENVEFTRGGHEHLGVAKLTLMKFKSKYFEYFSLKISDPLK